CGPILRDPPLDSRKCFEGVEQTLNGLASFSPTLSNPFSMNRKGENGTTISLMDPEMCIDHCADYLFAYAALKNSAECYCGNDSVTVYYNNPSNGTCNSTCAGNPNLTCGGENAFKVYSTITNSHYSYGQNININKKLELISKNSDPRYQGCFQDGPSCRTLNGTTPQVENSMTIDDCINICNQNSFKYAGLEDGHQCFCGNDYTVNGQASGAPNEQCSTSCVGNNSQICGGPFALSIYKVPNNSSTNSTLKIVGVVLGVLGGVLVLLFIARRIT
ncbi:553_t:CDS:2, partial [Ambispora gerdemannii]